MNKLILWLLSVLAIFALFFGTYRYGRHAEKVIQEAARTKAIAEQLAKNDALKTQLEVNHANDQKKIDSLAADLRTLRVRLPACSGNTNTTGGSENTTAGTGALPNANQTAFDRFNGGLAELAKEADDTVANCRVVMDWAKSL